MYLPNWILYIASALIAVLGIWFFVMVNGDNINIEHLQEMWDRRPMPSTNMDNLPLAY